MVNPSFHLFQLQKIDLKLDALLRRLSEIDKIRNDNSMRKELEKAVSNKKDLLASVQSIYDDTEDKVRLKRLKVEQSESSLYGGSIKNPKELQDLQIEIQSLKNSIITLEDTELEQMVQLEAKESDLNEATKALELFEKELVNQFSLLIAEENEKNIELERLTQERNAVRDQVALNYLEVYNVLRKTKKGIAISPVEDGCCSACGNTLTPADCQTAKSPVQMATCNSCNRILYAG